MILAQVFKTAEGADKRARFENSLKANAAWQWAAIRFYKGERDREAFSRERWADYTWQLEKLRRTAR